MAKKNDKSNETKPPEANPPEKKETGKKYKLVGTSIRKNGKHHKQDETVFLTPKEAKELGTLAEPV